MRHIYKTPEQGRFIDVEHNFRLSSDQNSAPAGVSLHADFFEARVPSVKQTFTTHCHNASKDCHAYLLGKRYDAL
jgi:hypothetical protein